MPTKIVIASAVAVIAVIADNIDAAKFRKEVFPMFTPDVENLGVIREKTNKRLIRQVAFIGAAAAAGFTVNREFTKMITK